MFLVLVVMGCDKPSVPPIFPPPEELAVSIVLNPSETRQKALVTWVAAVDANKTELVSNAIIRIGGIQFSAVPPESVDVRGYGGFYTYNYFSDLLKPLAGGSYWLEITTANRSIRGETSIPGDFSIYSQGMTISWSRSLNASHYHITVMGSNPSSSGWKWISEYTTNDTAITVTPTTGFIEGIHSVTVQAYDKNLHAFTQKKVLRAGIEYGYGIFGAIMVKQIELYLRP